MTTYLSRAQTTARMAQRLPSTDQGRIAWGLLSEADQDVCMERAQAAIDDCKWRGRVVESDQEMMWPRFVLAGGFTRDGESGWEYLDADPSGDTDAQVASIPRAVKDAFAVQCAHEALRARGLDVNAHVEDAARMGIVSQSEGGQSLTVNAAVATNPFARLCGDAQRRLAHLRVTTTSME